MEVLGEVFGRAHHPLLLGVTRCFAGDDVPRRHRHRPIHRESLAIEVGNRHLLRRVVDHDEVPSLGVRAARRLGGEVDALVDQLARDETVEVEPLAYGAGGGEELVG